MAKGLADWYLRVLGIMELAFLDLKDVPSVYNGYAGRGLRVTADESELEWSDSKPDAHASRHQNGGADEISVQGLSGLLADDQHVLDAEVQALATKVKIGTFTREFSAPSGDVSYTGVGFKPSFIIALAGVQNNTEGMFSIGFGMLGAHGSMSQDAQSHRLMGTSNLVDFTGTPPDGQYGAIISMDDDGFTLRWTKLGSPSGTITVVYLAHI